MPIEFRPKDPLFNDDDRTANSTLPVLPQPDLPVVAPDPNAGQVPEIPDGTPVVTDQDYSRRFDNDSNELNDIVNSPFIEDDLLDFEDPTTETKTETAEEASGNEQYDLYKKSVAEGQKQAEIEAADAIKEHRSLYKIQLANIDATARATIARIDATFNQRIEVRKRQNKLREDRLRAYGLEGGTAQFLPQGFSDAITETERKGADQIASLESQRQALIDQARAAQREGNATLLAQKISDYKKIKDDLNDRLAEIEREDRIQYEFERSD